MKILQINALDIRGGAAKVAERLGRSLSDRGHEVRTLVASRLGTDESTRELPYRRRSKRLNYLLHSRGMFLPTARTVGGHPWFCGADILHLHNLHFEPYGYFNIRDLPELSAAKPTVWTLHDPWVLHEDGHTPEYSSLFPRRRRVVGRLKRHAIERSAVTFVVPSSWLAQLVSRVYPDKPVELIPHGVDTKLFHDRGKVAARELLGIAEGKRVVLFVAHGGESNVPKGGTFVAAARAALEAEDVTFVSLGAPQDGRYIEDESELATYYAAADALLLPSAAENFSLAVLESMACGTPVVAFRIGGLSDAVRHLEDGYLAAYGDADDLIAGLSFVLTDPRAEGFGDAAARRVRQEFDLEQMTERYLCLYSRITHN